MTAKNPSAVVGPIATIFKINDGFMSRAVDGLTSEELWHRPTGHNNPILWLLGHVVQNRAGVVRSFGEPFDTGWGELFLRGSQLQEAARYPSVEEIRRVLDEVNRRLYERLESIDDLQLAQPAAGTPVPQVKTVADRLAFFAFHDSYHVGQMGFVRKGLGRSPLAG
jgi:uncharacterized damage-inducible protein DinB